MTTVNTKQISWQERLSIAKHFNLSDAQIMTTFNTSAVELTTANSLVGKGLIKVQPLSEVDQLVWATKLAQNSKPTEVIASTVINTDVTTHTSTNKPKATNTSGVKRGRTGNRIVTALNAIPTTPVPIEAFLAEHKVSKTVLRQSKRFLPTPIKISIRADKVTGVEMISRSM